MRILLVAYYFPPFNSVGAVRPGKLARFLMEQGHEVHVLTCSNQPYPPGLPVDIPPARITATPAWSVNAPVEWVLGGRDKVAREGFGGGGARHPVVHRLGMAYRTLVHWPDAQIGWVRGALAAGRRLLTAHRFDVVYATAPPFSALRVAARLARSAGLPWVAELRDLWTQNHAYPFPAWRRAIEARTEARLLATASALVTVSPPLAAKLAALGMPVWEIRNGCDPEDFAGLQRPPTFVASGDTLRIVFTGNIYPGHYDVQSFCAGLRLFLDEGGRAEVHVAGRNTGALREAARGLGVADAFRFEATLPRNAALAMQRYADVLLFFLWDADAGDGVFSLKLFEYAGAGRPVLAVGPAGSDVAGLLQNSGLGVACESARCVADRLHELKASKQSLGSLEAVKRPGYDFSRRTQFRQLERHLQDLVGSREG
jgi:glycosyltransferase involved in cell wall biosynthesis